MLIPVRCYSCGKVTGNMWEPYQKLLSEGVPIGDALTQLGLKRMCCRRILMTHVDLFDKVMQYSEYNDRCKVSCMDPRDYCVTIVNKQKEKVHQAQQIDPDEANEAFEKRLAQLRVD